MIHLMWRLGEDTPDNLGLVFTDDGLLLGRTPLIERRGGRFVVREPSEIARLLMYSFPQGCPVERIIPGLARIALALNTNDQATARFAAVHLQIPDLPNVTKRNAMIAQDALIKYARGEGGASDWNPALHPRTGVPPNPGWFATTDSDQVGPKQDESSGGPSRLRFAENQEASRRTDVAPAVDDQKTLQPGNPIDEPATFTDQPDWNHFWSDIWPAIKDWLEELVPEYDLDSGRAVGERPRWRAIAPYLGIPAATAAAFGVEAFAPTVAAWFGLHAPEAAIIANAVRGAASEARVLKDLGLVKNTRWVTAAEGRAIPDAMTDIVSVEIKDAAYVSATRQLRIQSDAAAASGRESILITGARTRISRTVLELFKPVVRRSDLGPR
jgi:hypothetical protein